MRGNLFDINVLIGSWPFHTLRNNDADAVLRVMKRAGIGRAAVSALEALYCHPRDLPEVNALLFERVREHPAVLHPFYAIHPGMPDALRETFRLRAECGLAGIRLYPAYHGYSLRDAKVKEYLDEISELGIPVYMTFRFEDERVHHPLAVVPPVRLGDLAEALRQHPNLTWIVGGIRIYEIEELLAMCRHGQMYVDMSFIQTPFRSLKRLVGLVGASRVLFGTGLPYWVPECALLKLEKESLTEEERELIARRNALNIMSGSDYREGR